MTFGKTKRSVLNKKCQPNLVGHDDFEFWKIIPVAKRIGVSNKLRCN